MGCFIYQYPKQILTIEQQVQSYIDAGMKITFQEDVDFTPYLHLWKIGSVDKMYGMTRDMF